MVQWLDLVTTIAKVMLSSPAKADLFSSEKKNAENARVGFQNSTRVDEGRKRRILPAIKVKARTVVGSSRNKSQGTTRGEEGRGGGAPAM